MKQSILKLTIFIEIQHSQGNKIGDEGAKNIAEALTINNTLTTLVLVRFVYFLKQINLEIDDFIEILHRAMKLEMKEQRTLQKCWQSTTH